jgi:hypothetical protein
MSKRQKGVLFRFHDPRTIEVIQSKRPRQLVYADPVSLARRVQTVFLRMSLQAAAGNTRDDLAAVARRAMRVLSVR